jgi:hypothetical protein
MKKIDRQFKNMKKNGKNVKTLNKLFRELGGKKGAEGASNKVKGLKKQLDALGKTKGLKKLARATADAADSAGKLGAAFKKSGTDAEIALEAANKKA